MQRDFKVILERDEDGIYVARVPELPGCVSDGKTKKEALKNIREAIEGYIETLHAEGWPLPKVISEETVTVDIKSLSAKLPVLSSTDVVKAFAKIDYVFARQRGSHIILVNRETRKIAVIPKRKEIPKGTLRVIISISDEAYSRLAARKKPHESFTDVINRLTEKRSILELAGTLSVPESKEVTEQISDLRKKSAKRIGTVVRRM